MNETYAPEIRAEPPIVEIRPLVYADLPQVIEVERRAFPTPWSLAMFVLELSKPSGVCLAASIDGRLVGWDRHAVARLVEESRDHILQTAGFDLDVFEQTVGFLAPGDEPSLRPE